MGLDLTDEETRHENISLNHILTTAATLTETVSPETKRDVYVELALVHLLRQYLLAIKIF